LSQGVSIRTPASAAEWDAYYHFRWRYLRAPWQQPPGSERDELEQLACHFAAYDDSSGDLVAVGRLHWPAPGQAQIRYMAVIPERRGLGIGTRLMTALETTARAHQATEIILQARDGALAFYQRLGYRNLGPSHRLFGVIQHYQMSKQLSGPGPSRSEPGT